MKEKLKNKKVIYTIIGIVSVLLVALAVTYAYWLVTKIQDNENVISSACLDISISGEKNDITLTNQLPIRDIAGMKLVPYEFTVTNNCNTSVDYQIALEVIGDEINVINTSSIKIALNDDITLLSNNDEVTPTIEDAYESRKLGIWKLAASGNEESSVTHKLRIWVDENAPISEMNKTFKSRISVTIGQGIDKPLSSVIIAHAIENNYFYETTPSFTTNNNINEIGLYTLEDDYGTSYYFRGNVENNYVELGEYKTDILNYYVESYELWYETYDECIAQIELGAPWPAEACTEKVLVNANDKMYWRIVRINGDGTVRLVYDGTTLSANGTIGTGFWMRSIFNNIDTATNPVDIKYAGYTYDDGTGRQVDSTIKANVDKWYENYLKKDNEKYLSDSIFCNDKKYMSNNEFSSYVRLYSTNNRAPILTCENKNDRYTVNDTINGNGLLLYPIGLMTADEMILAGYKEGVNEYESSIHPNFLTKGEHVFSTITPSLLHTTYGVRIWSSSANGNINPYYYGSNYSYFKPVINLKSDVKFTGNGTIDNPYKIID